MHSFEASAAIASQTHQSGKMVNRVLYYRTTLLLLLALVLLLMLLLQYHLQHGDYYAVTGAEAIVTK